MNDYPIRIRSFGVHAILVEWPDQVDTVVLNDILQYAQCLREHFKAEPIALVTAYNSLTLISEREPLDLKEMESTLFALYEKRTGTPPGQKYLWRLPVCYDAEFGIDLEAVSDRLGLSTEELITLHTKNSYTVYGIGFLPGFMYLGGLTAALEIPRRPKPRLRVRKGAVGLAGKQTGIYPQESPGGWNIIGNCSVPIFDATKETPCLISVGDQVQFYAISRSEYELHKIEGEVGIYQVEKSLLNG
ncbi:5-oxoprolinase subunit PxpB [Maribacter sp. 2-571]|uniref:5-oxoprolinase subunit PxpB n=1 Tax=Maribacter sp. 2-571 TaxID=3417569 RepID=UPI003D32A39B